MANGWRPFGRLGRLVSRSSTLAGPPALGSQQQAELKAAVQAPPTAAGIDLADWNWKVVREFVQRRFGSTLSRSSCLNYLHRLDFVLKRPKKRLVKANAECRAAFVREYALLRAAAQATGAKLFFADEAHFYADVDLRGEWVLRGEPALVESTSPRWGEKASYYSAVCLETGEVEAMELDGTSTAATSVAFLQQMRAHHPEPLIVIGIAHSRLLKRFPHGLFTAYFMSNLQQPEIDPGVWVGPEGPADVLGDS